MFEIHTIPLRARLRQHRAPRGRGRRAAPLLDTLVLVTLAWSAIASQVASAKTPDFDVWLSELRREAIAGGISEATVQAALSDLEPLPRVLELDRGQPRKPTEFCGYMERRLTSTRIARGRRVLGEHAALLREIREAYGVPERYIVSIWGLESNFGDYQGDYPVVASLATLAYDPRRGEMFRNQLLAALRILDEGHVEIDAFRGSWAGAMGQVQFMPSTFLSYAVDHDGDGRKDIWGSVDDSLASAANFLRNAGWRPGETWGRPVQLPPELGAERPRGRKPLAEWQRRGVRRSDGGDLPAANVRGAIVLPRREPEPAFLVYANYHSFMKWNRSTFFAISLGTLSDRVAHRDDTPLCGR